MRLLHTTHSLDPEQLEDGAMVIMVHDGHHFLINFDRKAHGLNALYYGICMEEVLLERLGFQLTGQHTWENTAVRFRKSQVDHWDVHFKHTVPASVQLSLPHPVALHDFQRAYSAYMNKRLPITVYHIAGYLPVLVD